MKNVEWGGFLGLPFFFMFNWKDGDAKGEQKTELQKDSLLFFSLHSKRQEERENNCEDSLLFLSFQYFASRRISFNCKRVPRSSFLCLLFLAKTMKRKGGIARFRVLPCVSLLSFEKGFLISRFSFSQCFRLHAVVCELLVSCWLCTCSLPVYSRRFLITSP